MGTVFDRETEAIGFVKSNPDPGMLTSIDRSEIQKSRIGKTVVNSNGSSNVDQFSTPGTISSFKSENNMMSNRNVSNNKSNSMAQNGPITNNSAFTMPSYFSGQDMFDNKLNSFLKSVNK